MRLPAPAAIACTLAAATLAGAQNLAVTATEPPANTIAERSARIAVTFDRPVRRESVTDRSFWAFARWGGVVTGTIGFEAGDTVVTLTPEDEFLAADVVTVFCSHDLVGADGSPLREAGYSFQFLTRAAAARMDFQRIDTLDVRSSPSVGTRAYGGIASDLNHDRAPDLTIVNEDTADLRVFMNRADGTGLFDDFLRPTFPVQDRASPSEPADFNRDGNVDICVVNINTNRVSVLLGRGDGTFDPQTLYDVGATPRGIAVLDANGDGAMDIVNTNSGSSNLSILLNDGAGAFAPATYFDGGGNGEWALGAADMDLDGILDLVVGARNGATVHILRGNGDGTFAPGASRSCGGQVWQLNAADLNGDRYPDVAVANSFTDNAAILMNDGAGGLLPAVTYPSAPFAIATDVGDLDGDRDLDWTVSCYDGEWRVYANDGAGNFTLIDDIIAPQSGSCALLADINGDHRTDLALIDEEQDVVLLDLNCRYADCDGNALLDLFDFLCFQNAFATADPYADCDGAGALDLFDFLCFQNEFAAGCR
ncbi:MAG: FG-GAP-like repeat-containing protein [Phycisphaerales bacterium JB039]